MRDANGEIIYPKIGETWRYQEEDMWVCETVPNGEEIGVFLFHRSDLVTKMLYVRPDVWARAASMWERLEEAASEPAPDDEPQTLRTGTTPAPTGRQFIVLRGGMPVGAFHTEEEALEEVRRLRYYYGNTVGWRWEGEK